MNLGNNRDTRSHRAFPYFGFGLFFRHRHLIGALALRDIKAHYRQTLLGPLWHLLHPLLNTAVFSVIFSKIVRSPAGDTPYPVFFLSGFIVWNYFAECLNRTSSVFKDHLPILSTLYLPRIAIPAAVCLSLLLRFGIQFLVLMIVATIFFPGRSWVPASSLFASLLVLVPVTFQGLGCGLVLASLTCRYKDLGFLLSFSLQLLMYTTPVVYPLARVPLKLKWLVSLNPLTPMLETFRYLLFHNGQFSSASLVQCVVLSTIILAVGLALFSKIEKTFIDHI